MREEDERAFAKELADRFGSDCFHSDWIVRIQNFVDEYSKPWQPEKGGCYMHGGTVVLAVSPISGYPERWVVSIGGAPQTLMVIDTKDLVEVSRAPDEAGLGIVAEEKEEETPRGVDAVVARVVSKGDDPDPEHVVELGTWVRTHGGQPAYVEDFDGAASAVHHSEPLVWVRALNGDGTRYRHSTSAGFLTPWRGPTLLSPGDPVWVLTDHGRVFSAWVKEAPEEGASNVEITHMEAGGPVVTIARRQLALRAGE